ncbi:MAG: hypothetical protein JSW00_19125 [Thermoplasmata archaeon]|nr:MAG: hypothetical protein JSW00_19125 [Thermoplasmata archaeon]
MKIKASVIVIYALLLLTAFNSGCFEEDGDDKKERKVKITEVSQNPKYPKAGEEIIITVYVENCSGVEFNRMTYFMGGNVGGWGMDKVSDGKYETKIGPFSNGTEVWYIVSASGYNDAIFVTEEYIIQIGEIERSDVTTLAILNIHHSPQNPTTKDSIVTITADITSNITLSLAWFGFAWFSRSEQSGRGGKMLYVSGNTYESQIYLPYENKKGTQVYYKIAAQDESGNTAVSPTFNFTI